MFAHCSIVPVNIKSTRLSQLPNQKDNPSRPLSLFSAEDRRSADTTAVISEALHLSAQCFPALSAFVGSASSGLPQDTLYELYPDFGKKATLYRAGLLSAYEVPWPSGEIRTHEKTLQTFWEQHLLVENTTAVIISHKSVLTCLAILALKKFGNYPSNYYGYIDFPLGSGWMFQIKNDVLSVSPLDFQPRKKYARTDVVIKNGLIVFPESACAVCWQNDALLLVTQNRNGKNTWELPGGKIEEAETAEEAAARELQEESGIQGHSAKLLYSLDLDLSISNHRTHLVAFDCEPALQETLANTRWVPYHEVSRMIHSGEITHAPTIVAFLQKEIERG